VNFISADSTAYAKPISPQSWNLYAYARNNPLLYTDPSGHTVALANWGVSIGGYYLLLVIVISFVQWYLIGLVINFMRLKFMQHRRK
jgi:hypothetical protein